MSSMENNVEILTDFGLTRNQAKVYLTIARMGLATVGKTAKISKVRREDVYRMLPKLEEMGLVERLLGKPTKIRATPVEEALSILIKQEEKTARKRVSAMKAKTETFLKHFARAPRLEEEEKGNFFLLSKPENVMAKMLIIIKKAEREICFAFSRNQIMQLVHGFGEELKSRIKKGVRIRLVSELPEYEDSLPRVLEERISPSDSLDLRYTDLLSTHYMIADLKECLISTSSVGNMAEHPCLWTNSDSLVGVFQGDFENLWHNAVSWKNIETIAVPEKVVSYMEKLRPTNHLIFVYDSQEGKHNVLFNYLKVGLDKGEAGLYVASDEDPNQIRDAMKRFGIEVEEYEKAGALNIITYEDIYIADEEFSVAHTMNSWDNVYRRALENGFKGIRVTGETAWFFKRKLIPELVQYEKSLHRCLDIPMIVICAYKSDNLNKCRDPINTYSELARAHGTILFTGLDNKLGRMEIRGI